MRVGPWGRRVATDAGAGGVAVVATAAPATYVCERCGAVLAYEPGAQTLVCRYCGHENRIRMAEGTPVENELDPVLRRLPAEPPVPPPIPRKCGQCAYEFTLPPGRHAGPCPSCGSPSVADPAAARAIAPDGVLPFVIAEPDGRRLVRQWLEGLWFAPSRLAKEARTGARLEGLYVPHWTFDAQSRSWYRGRRGDVYYETRWVERVVDGRRVRQAVQVPKIRWTPVEGRLARDFDDVLVVAGDELPERLVERLDPWDLQGLKGYGPDYLAGFASELYKRSVADAHEAAKARMRAVIEQDAKIAIGGDQQIVERLDITLANETYKLVLLPIWVARFKFLGKDYRVLVNGRTGEVHGERPWSLWKILGAVLLALLVLFGLFVLGRAGSGGFEF
jgi:DNA-directed RNA polymerase subunit RPC12/RpoP